MALLLRPRHERRQAWRESWSDFKGAPPPQRPRPSWLDSAAKLLAKVGKKVKGETE